MGNKRNHISSMSDASGQKLETFSYLTAMDSKRLRKQIEYILNNGWDPAIEHTLPANVFDHYWHMWKLPMFSETNIEKILVEIEACHKAFPDNHVRLIGYNHHKQTQGTAMVVYRSMARV